MCRPRIAAPQLLHRFVLNADPFLPDIRRFLDSRLYWPRVFHIRHDCFCADRKAADSAAADVILSQGLWLGAGHVRALRTCSRSRGCTKSQQEKIMKYLLLIAATMALTSVTSISSSDTGCCGGCACCPGACCMMMTR